MRGRGCTRDTDWKNRLVLLAVSVDVDVPFIVKPEESGKLIVLNGAFTIDRNVR